MEQSREIGQREATIIKMRHEGQSLAQIGSKIGVSRGRVRWILLRCLGDSLTKKYTHCGFCGKSLDDSHPSRKYCPGCAPQVIRNNTKRYEKLHGDRAKAYRQTLAYAATLARSWLRKVRERGGDPTEVLLVVLEEETKEERGEV